MNRLMIASIILLLGHGASTATPTQILQGSGAIAGYVRNAETATAVAGAQVRLEIVASLSSSPEIRSVVSDSGGRFVFGNLALGTYRLFASFTGFVTREYGQQESGSPGTPIAVAADQKLSGLVVQLVPVGTISGVVRTDDGLPAKKVPV
jgi:hypothetical protein